MTAAGHDRSGWRLSLGIFVFLVASIALSIYILEPPRPKPAAAPAAEFSAVRAIEHDKVVAVAPHPAGSPANDATAAYIVETMRGFGIETELHSEPYVRGHSGGTRNVILARIPGTANNKAFAMTAHYDSVPYGFGAADDCAGVSAMLEIARALKAGSPLRNDIIFAFTDSEENGMLGAHAFAAHPWFQETGVMLNFEARGTQGPSMMFSTSTENGWLIQEFAKAAPYPYANSLMYDVYKRMPFSSDFDRLKGYGAKGFDIAFVDNFAYYHTRNDHANHLSLASLQHHGSYGLGLARHFGNIEIGEVDAPDACYFNALGFQGFVHYPLSWHRPLAIAAACVFALVAVFGLVRRHITVRGFIAGVFGFLFACVCASLVVLLLVGVVFGPRVAVHFYAVSITDLPDLYALYHNNLYGAAFGLMAIAMALLVYGWLAKHVRPQNLACGALVWWVAGLVALEMMLPGGAYVATWPLLFSSIGLAVLFLVRDADAVPAPVAAATVAFALPGILIVAPYYRAFLSTVMIMTGPVLVLLAVFVLALCLPAIAVMLKPGRFWMPALLAGAAVFFVAFGLVNSGYSPARPKLNSVVYGLNVDTQQAFWASSDADIDEWTSQFFAADSPEAPLTEIWPDATNAYRKAPAPVAAALTGPNIEVLRDVLEGNEREIALKIASPTKAALMEVEVVSETSVHNASVLGMPAEGNGKRWRFRFNLFPRDGADLVLRTDLEPLTILLRETHYGLPETPGIRPRPDYMVPEPNTVKHLSHVLHGERTYVVRTATFPAPNTP